MRERSLGTGRQSFISGNHRYGWLTLGLVMLVFGIVFGVTAFTMSDPPRRVGFAVVFLALAAVSVEFSRANVVVDRVAGVVRVRNLVRTVVVPLGDIAGFEAYGKPSVGTSKSWGWRVVQLRRNDGSTVFCRGLTATGYGQTVRMASRLNEFVGLDVSATLPAARVPDLTRQAAESAAQIPDINQGIAEFAASLGKTIDKVSRAEVEVFLSERRRWLSRDGNPQDGELALGADPQADT